MGLLGLRKFIDSCWCTRLLPVPVSDTEAQAEALRRLRVEGYRDVVGDEDDEGDGNGEASGAQGVYVSGSGRGSERKGTGQHGLTSSTHAIGTTATPVVDHVLVDMNCIVHACFHHQSSENKTKKQLIQEVLERLRVLLTEVVVPRQSLSLCFDGPAPIAKLQTQRLRRRRVGLLDTGGLQQLNTLAITAGSLFMIELENAIAAQFKLNHGRGFLRRLCPVYLYGTTVMGEGEAKISRALAFLAYGPIAKTDTNAEGGGDAGGDGNRAHRYRGGGGGGGNYSHKFRSNHTAASSAAASTGHHAAPTNYPHYCPDDSIVVLGNDIDLVLTCLGATAYHNLSIVSPSSLQLIRVSDIIYRWLKTTSATRGDAPFSPAQLPSIRIDFTYLFLLNGGDHYVGAGEVAMSLWKRYRSVRATYPYSTLVSPNMDAIDVDFLADVVEASEYTGSSSVEVGVHLLQSALWSLYTVVTGVCPDYNYVPETEAPLLCHLRAAAAHCQRTNRGIRLTSFDLKSQPLTPLETYVALMPTEATLPKSVAAGLRSKPAYQSILKTLETSNDTAMIAQAAKDAVEVSDPFLTTSERYLRHFTSPVQLNVVPPRRRLSRHEQHRMLATQGRIQVEDPVPVVQPIAMAEEVPYMDVSYPAHTSFLDFYCPFDARINAEEEAEGTQESEEHQYNGSAVTRATATTVQGRVVSTRPSLHATAVTAGAAHFQPNNSKANTAADNGGAVHKRVYLYQEEAAQQRHERERQSAASKLQRALAVTTNILQRGQHFTAAQERQMRRKLERLQQAETTEMRSRLAKEDRHHAVRGGDDADDLEAELRRFLGEHASSTDVQSLLAAAPAPAGTAKKGRKGLAVKAAVGQLVKKSTASRKSPDAGRTAHTAAGAAATRKPKRKRGDSTRMRDAEGHDTVLSITGDVSSGLRWEDRERGAESGSNERPLKKQKRKR
ncbi:hypothetical protein ABB37_06634 [Leptomonas pyrrhocoris]|uniref:Xrn1 N-terminal domain-containing protein n=1 Tax=Leptomonas pyrrhocoris TaxID=157538 RepID=A0A0M9FX96_LEPPY|nr:hypothetical protein ABB37_06634 [Leptomonas pyrrhocoris]KPA77817.1 hypothetical protein ABB37_06634 [Leptomonas pyrrhocoris]|eukprot:XP_015656256.1 hypothetical protein ABB37_06634 [Leptomonas pyrrhocoris]